MVEQETFFLGLLIILGMCGQICWGRSYFVELTAVEQLREDYLIMEDIMWNKIFNQRQPVLRHRELIQMYTNFTDGPLSVNNSRYTYLVVRKVSF